MGLLQDLQYVAKLQREPTTISAATGTLTGDDIATGSITCTYGGTQTVTVPSEKGPPFFVVAVGGYAVTISGLYSSTTNVVTSKLSALVHYVDGKGWYAMCSVASI